MPLFSIRRGQREPTTTQEPVAGTAGAAQRQRTGTANDASACVYEGPAASRSKRGVSDATVERLSRDLFTTLQRSQASQRRAPATAEVDPVSVAQNRCETLWTVARERETELADMRTQFKAAQRATNSERLSQLKTRYRATKEALADTHSQLLGAFKACVDKEIEQANMVALIPAVVRDRNKKGPALDAAFTELWKLETTALDDLRTKLSGLRAEEKRSTANPERDARVDLQRKLTDESQRRLSHIHQKIVDIYIVQMRVHVDKLRSALEEVLPGAQTPRELRTSPETLLTTLKEADHAAREEIDSRDRQLRTARAEPDGLQVKPLVMLKTVAETRRDQIHDMLIDAYGRCVDAEVRDIKAIGAPLPKVARPLRPEQQQQLSSARQRLWELDNQGRDEADTLSTRLHTAKAAKEEGLQRVYTDCTAALGRKRQAIHDRLCEVYQCIADNDLAPLRGSPVPKLRAERHATNDEMQILRTRLQRARDAGDAASVSLQTRLIGITEGKADALLKLIEKAA